MTDQSPQEVPGTITGPWRRPRNLSAEAAGSIHDDATAAELGFKGGTVAGNIHLVQFVPLLHQHFGDDWFRTGTLSVMFRQATVDLEPVRAHLQPAGEQRVAVRMETEAGEETASGSATIGEPGELSLLRARDYRPVDPSELTILADIAPDMEFPARAVAVNSDRHRSLLANGLLTEPMPQYSDSTEWGGPIASPLTEVDLLTKVEPDMLARIQPGTVGMYGAIELARHGRPVTLDTIYEVSGRVIALSDSPRTEIIWYESTASLDGEPIITMLMMSRLLKASGG